MQDDDMDRLCVWNALNVDLAADAQNMDLIPMDTRSKEHKLCVVIIIK